MAASREAAVSASPDGEPAAGSVGGGPLAAASSALDRLSTEAARPELADLDLWATGDAVRLLIDDQRHAVDVVGAAVPQISAVADAVAHRLGAGGRLVYLGAGTGGRLGAVDAAEIGPTYGLHDRVIGLLAGGPDSMVDGREFYEDDAAAGAAAVAALRVGPDDVVLGISASGRTPYVLGGVRAAADAGALTVALAGVVGSPLATLCDLSIEIDTGGEAVAGSTRLKAGTAQKIVLNTISTLAMIRLGRTYGNLMVDVTADNDKLRRRALRTVVQATGAGETDAAAALDDAGGSAKVAVVALLARVPAGRARELLDFAEGRVRVAVTLARNGD